MNDDSILKAELLKTQNELRSLNMSLNQIEKLAKIGHWELNLTTNQLYWSPAIFEIFEIDPAKFPTSYEDFLNAIHPEDRDLVNQAYTASLQTKTPYGIVHRLLMPSGEIKYVEEQCETDFDPQGKALISRGTVQDISQRFHQEEEARKLQEKFFFSTRLASIGQLAAGVGHEINNPLMIISTATQLMRNRLMKTDRLDESVVRFMSMSFEAIKRIEVIVNALRTYARIDNEKPSPIDLNKSIEKSLALLKAIYEHQGVKIHLDLSKTTIHINTVMGRLQQIVVNLLSNAKDALETSERKEIWIRTYPMDEKAYIEIEDTGCGISDENQKKIFDSFFTTKEVGKGSGLGLNIVFNLISQMNGKIDVKSTIGVGTKFTICFPLTEQSASSNITPSSIEGLAPLHKNENLNLQVLIVDDEPTILEALSNYLLSMNCEVTVLDNAFKAKDAILEGKTYDVIICDNAMPNYTGLEFLNDIKDIYKGKKILITGQTDLLPETDLADLVLTKPFSMEALAKELRKST